MNAYEAEKIVNGRDFDRDEEIREEDWDDLFDGYFYEDPMERAMREVGMSWSDFI